METTGNSNWHSVPRVFALSSLISLALGSASLARGANVSLAEKDLALAIPHNLPGLIGSDSTLESGEALFPRAWYDAVLRGYADTAVADALQRENSFREWKLVSARIAPCEPIGAVADQDVDRLCWPEVRLVWQPVIRDFVRFGRRLEAYSDDRAIHIGYRVLPEGVLPAQQVAEVNALLQKADRAREQARPQIKPLSEAELARLGTLRSAVVNSLLQDVLRLRSGKLSAASYQGLGLRPEALEGTAEQAAFLGRLRSFLSRYASPQRLHALTSFSLPEGRDPPLFDEWIFLAFKPTARGLVQVPITLHSARDGRALGPGQMAPRASMNSEDESFTSGNIAGRDWQEAGELLFLDAARPDSKRELLSDRRRVLIRNTSCSSCHKMNGNLFDFHNFGFLEDAELTISPRVVRDVELDLAWIRKHL